jgi:hypothetical protein
LAGLIFLLLVLLLLVLPRLRLLFILLRQPAIRLISGSCGKLEVLPNRLLRITLLIRNIELGAPVSNPPRIAQTLREQPAETNWTR